MSAALTHSSCSVLPATTRSNHPARPACLHKAAPVLRLAAPTLVRPAQRLQQARPARSVFVRAFDETALKETAALDELVDALLSAGSQQELARIVAENIFAIDAKFWLRVANRNDSASSKADKDKLEAVARAVMTLVDRMLKSTEQQLSDSAKVLQDILTAAADGQGEWYLPLEPAKVQAVRDALERNSAQLDEALLSNAFAWIKKCSEDGFDTMVTLIQKILQLYAARQLRSGETSGTEGAVNEVVYAEEEAWGGLIRRAATEQGISEAAFMEALQRKMEATVLGLQSGSYAQRIQAEYLKEVEARAKKVYKELAATQ